MCEPAWTGADCSLLNFKPAPNHVSFHGASDKMIKAEADRLCRTMARTSCLQVKWLERVDWTHDRRIVPSSLQRRASPKDRMWNSIKLSFPGARGHNPQMIHTGKTCVRRHQSPVWALYTLGDGVSLHGLPVDCTSDDTKISHLRFHQTSCGCKDWLSGGGLITLRERSTWGKLCRPLLDSITIRTIPQTCFIHRWLSSAIRFPRKLESCTSHIARWADAYISPYRLPHGLVRYCDCRSQSWKGPYRSVTTDITRCTECEEDPFVLLDHCGYWNALYIKCLILRRICPILSHHLDVQEDIPIP